MGPTLTEWGEGTKDALRKMISEGVFNKDDIDFVLIQKIY